jgi:hypothetical protein
MPARSRAGWSAGSIRPEHGEQLSTADIEASLPEAARSPNDLERPSTLENGSGLAHRAKASGMV